MADFTSHFGDATYLDGRAILAPTLSMVDMINDYMVSKDQSDVRTYLSSDGICQSESDDQLLSELHTPEFLNGFKCSGVPNHELKLKVGVPVMLMRNIDHLSDLCNGTRLMVTKLADHVIEASILNGFNQGKNS
ncbi:unnamed protein product [Cuscuta europaea]|uniref:DNA helicase Pif1-like 2B domain-containing protein n=1 Tax=Cuscuta europaea TaxID=41803 RepID=A0A9P0Z5P5_CUSEU|nr:unnamed protein product [Cuscuta europaea]